MSRTYCTLFDTGFLGRGLAMIRSLQRVEPDAHVYVLCMDDGLHKILGSLEPSNVKLIALSDFLTPELAAARAERTWREFCWTCTASLLDYIFEKHGVALLTYLDADIFFYSSPAPIFQEMADSSALIIPHRYPPRLKHLEVRGIYNVQFMPFCNNLRGRKILNWWKRVTVEWCFNRDEPGRFGDQKYLDDWPSRFEGVHVLEHIGAGVAPWNFENFDFSETGRGIEVSGCPLIFYHFSQFKLCDNGKTFRMGYPFLGTRPIPAVVYERYEAALQLAHVEIAAVESTYQPVREKYWRLALSDLVRRLVPYRFKQFVKRRMGSS